MDKLQSELDQAFRSVFSTMDGYLVASRELEAMLKHGWMDMASARYSMGTGSISAAEYPGSMEASATVSWRSAGYPGSDPSSRGLRTHSFECTPSR